MSRLKELTLLCALLAIPFAGAGGQVTEIFTPPAGHTVIAMVNVGPAGPVTLAQINAGGLPSPGSIMSLTMPLNPAFPNGVYNTNPIPPRALGVDVGGAMILVDAPAGVFQGFEPATIVLNAATTEFGASIGDFTGAFTWDCQLAGVSVGTASVMSDGLIHYVQSVMPFDTVVLNGGGNWVIGDLVVPPGNNILEMSESGPGVGDLMVTLSMVSPTATEGFTLVSTEIGGPAGGGPMIGITPITVSWEILGYPIQVGNPFHFPIGTGFYPDAQFVLGPGETNALAGQTMDFVTLLLDLTGGYDSRSNVVRFSFQ